jgi:predicted amidohydrolase
VLVKVVAVQARLGQELSLSDRIHIFKQRPDFVCLPEYWQLDESMPDYQRAALRWTDHIKYLSRLSEELSTCLIGGTMVEPDGAQFYNVCLIFDRGQLIGTYRKRNPTPSEQAGGIAAGQIDMVIDHEGVKIGIMICADVFQPEQYARMSEQRVDLVFVPTVSPFLPDDTRMAKQERDRQYFVNGSQKSGAYVIKACGIGQLFSKPLQGRSLIAAPWGVLSQIESGCERDERLVTATLDIDELREFREKHNKLKTREV